MTYLVYHVLLSLELGQEGVEVGGPFQRLGPGGVICLTKIICERNLHILCLVVDTPQAVSELWLYLNWGTLPGSAVSSPLLCVEMFK